MVCCTGLLSAAQFGTGSGLLRGRQCRKRFCDRCLEEHHGVMPMQINPLSWICPACDGSCKCGPCVSGSSVPPTPQSMSYNSFAHAGMAGSAHPSPLLTGLSAHAHAHAEAMAHATEAGTTNTASSSFLFPKPPQQQLRQSQGQGRKRAAEAQEVSQVSTFSLASTTVGSKSSSLHSHLGSTTGVASSVLRGRSRRRYGGGGGGNLSPSGLSSRSRDASPTTTALRSRMRMEEEDDLEGDVEEEDEEADAFDEADADLGGDYRDFAASGEPDCEGEGDESASASQSRASSPATIASRSIATPTRPSSRRSMVALSAAPSSTNSPMLHGGLATLSLRHGQNDASAAGPLQRVPTTMAFEPVPALHALAVADQRRQTSGANVGGDSRPLSVVRRMQPPSPLQTMRVAALPGMPLVPHLVVSMPAPHTHYSLPPSPNSVSAPTAFFLPLLTPQQQSSPCSSSPTTMGHNSTAAATDASSSSSFAELPSFSLAHHSKRRQLARAGGGGGVVAAVAGHTQEDADPFAIPSNPAAYAMSAGRSARQLHPTPVPSWADSGMTDAPSAAPASTSSAHLAASVTRVPARDALHHSSSSEGGATPSPPSSSRRPPPHHPQAPPLPKSFASTIQQHQQQLHASAESADVSVLQRLQDALAVDDAMSDATTSAATSAAWHPSLPQRFDAAAHAAMQPMMQGPH